MSFYKDQLKSWLKYKEFNSDRVLSVGNMNDDSKYFMSFKANKVFTVDINGEYKPDYVFDLNEIVDCKISELAGTIDDIFAFELFEYLWNPVQAFTNFNLLLKKGGTLWLSVPFVYPIHRPSGTDYLRVTEHGIKRILKETGFEVAVFDHRVWRNDRGWKTAIADDGMKPDKSYRGHNSTGYFIKAIKK